MNEKMNTLPLTDGQRGDILNKHTEMQAYLNQVQTTIGGKQLFEDPGYSIDDVHKKLDEFKETVNKLFLAPAPEKSAEKKAEGANPDVEMKSEEKKAEETTQEA
jgi:hypothetical protein